MELDSALLDRYIVGGCTPSEEALVERWLAERPARRLYLRLLAERVSVADRRVTGDRVAAMLNALRMLAERTAADEVGKAGATGAEGAAGEAGEAGAQGAARAVRPFVLPISRRRPAIRLVPALAAMAAAVAFAGLLRIAANRTTAPAATHTVSTSPGERRIHQLPDGTRMILGPESRVEYPVPFRRGSGELRLMGEAYFEVAHDERRPFLVRAGDLVARDLGTQFIVRAHPGPEPARVVVREGKVALRAAGGSVERIVEPGEAGWLASNGEPVVEVADTVASFAWTGGVLMFDRTPLREAVVDLGRWYALHFVLADSSLGAISLSGTFEARWTDDALEAIASAMGLRQVRRGRTVTFYPNNQAP